MIVGPCSRARFNTQSLPFLCKLKPSWKGQPGEDSSGKKSDDGQCGVGWRGMEGIGPNKERKFVEEETGGGGEISELTLQKNGYLV